MGPPEPELEKTEVEIARQLGRESDPGYWRRKYFELLALNAQRASDRMIWMGGLTVSAAVGLVLLAAKWLLQE